MTDTLEGQFSAILCRTGNTATLDTALVDTVGEICHQAVVDLWATKCQSLVAHNLKAEVYNYHKGDKTRFLGGPLDH